MRDFIKELNERIDYLVEKEDQEPLTDGEQELINKHIDLLEDLKSALTLF